MPLVPYKINFFLAEIVTITEQKATLPELPRCSLNFIHKPSLPLLSLYLSSQGLKGNGVAHKRLNVLVPNREAGQTV